MKKFEPSYKAYVSAQTNKTNIVLHGSLSRTKHSFTAAQNKETCLIDKWNITADKCAGHYIVGRTGDVYSCVPEEYWSNHISPARRFSDISKRSVSIFLANEMSLEKENGRYYAFGFVKPHNLYTGKVFEQKTRFGNYWADYDDAQVIALALLLKDVCARNEIPLSLYRHTLKHNLAATDKAGIVSCANIDKESFSLPLPSWVLAKLEQSGISLVD